MIHVNSLNFDTWNYLDDSGNPLDGFKSVEITANGSEVCGYIFNDHNSKHHFAIEILEPRISPSNNFPQVTGMSVQIGSYLINGSRKIVIDGVCEIDEFLDEFTGVFKEILILIEDESVAPIQSVHDIMQAWVSFWSRPQTGLLNVEEQIGLIGELQVLKKLIPVNLTLALDCWNGPLGGKFDFTFTDWSFEVKATRSDRRVHIVNGIDQLEPNRNNKLAIISFQLQSTNEISGLNLSQEVRAIRSMIYRIDRTKFVEFASLISSAGYNLARDSEYENMNFEIINADFFEVNEEFPKLTSSMLNPPISPRVESVQYNIVLSHLAGTNLDHLVIGNYFY
ncbi:PD-(D/E)XK motif protein [Arenibacter sp. BSSL-BM3]|uniref:PD-(D/E)XK motif protein n=1 Tax=Arenibacter arenosicollis TaxID=2762274 RepID=A0ABR7QTA7_9FLAO|nr:PD-(D/E)XK motif protein [Arenibacter arenosicollis]MBC8770437.1 PD-(D/E)XK motif protein [Arenibacter arenosicollis]